MYRYETHCHTSPVSACASASVYDTLLSYQARNYAGVCITNHFLDGNMRKDPQAYASYEEQIEFYCSDYEEAARIAPSLGLQVFFGIELSYGGTDFLVYGIDKTWLLAHPEIMEMKKSEELPYLREHGALVIQAHPFREASYIDHIRLFPRCVEGVEILNASRPVFENDAAKQYAERYGLLPFAGSDNHQGIRQKTLAGMESPTPIHTMEDFITAVRDHMLMPFCETFLD